MNKRKITTWLISLTIAIGVFVFVRPTFAQFVEGESVGRSRSFADGLVEVGVDSVKGFQQVFYVLDGRKYYVTDGKLNSRHPSIAGEYMVWVTEQNGAGQVFLYHIPTEQKMQVTNSSTNIRPKVNAEGVVTWERWVSDRWQVFYFNGLSMKQLTNGDVSVSPEIDSDTISFFRKGKTGMWREISYSVSRSSFATTQKNLARKERTTSSIVNEVAPISVDSLLGAFDENESQASESIPISLKKLSNEEVESDILSLPKGLLLSP